MCGMQTKLHFGNSLIISQMGLTRPPTRRLSPARTAYLALGGAEFDPSVTKGTRAVYYTRQRGWYRAVQAPGVLRVWQGPYVFSAQARSVVAAVSFKRTAHSRSRTCMQLAYSTASCKIRFSSWSALCSFL